MRCASARRRRCAAWRSSGAVRSRRASGGSWSCCAPEWRRPGARWGIRSTRASYDATKGNAHGIARCILAGLTDDVVAPIRRAFLDARPGTEGRARSLFMQARSLEAQHALMQAVDCYGQALALDPLHLAGQRHYWTLRRHLRPMTMSVPTVAPQARRTE